MGKKIKVSLAEVEAVMRTGRSPARKLANLPEDFAVWLCWRKVMNTKVPAHVAGKLRQDVTHGMITNFFSSHYGIGPEPFHSFKEIYDYVNKKGRGQNSGVKYPITDYPGNEAVEKMIESCEEEFGDRVKKYS